uniref:Ionotropic glutamate receptor L-glutamate and glycine-binding domain-containing protein n=1 Tax=Acrobeloides nanus TaxID=290746 RepID=A0A914CP34_9BILA
MEMYQSFRGSSPKLEANETKIFRVATVLVDPFVMIKRDCEWFPLHSGSPPECKGNHRYEGYSIDLLKKMQEKIEDFEYEIFLSEGNKHGAKQADGTYWAIHDHTRTSTSRRLFVSLHDFRHKYYD